MSLDPGTALATPAFLAMAVAMCGWTIVENLVLKQDEPRDYRGKRNTRLLQVAMILTIYVGVADLFHLGWIGPSWLTLLGLVALAGGAGLRIVAIRTLDRHFRYELRVEASQGLIRSGPYAILRHPSYLGFLLIAVGAGLTLQSALAAGVALLMLVPILVHRIRVEEAVLRAGFGDAYERYARESWRLVPYLY